MAAAKKKVNGSDDYQERDFWSFLEGISSKQLSLSRSLSLSSAGAEKLYYYYGYEGYPFTVLLDGEACLHILYGRAFSDWVCGGQWAQMMKFLDALVGKLREYNVCAPICLNGAHEPQRFKEWVKHQKQLKGNANKIFRHLHRRAIPPPKAWWIPPSGIRSVIRLGLATLNNPAICSVSDHYSDMMDFVWKNNFQGVLGNHQDLIFFKPQRLFSARTMRISSDLDLITTEYNLQGAAKSLDLNPARFCLLGALIGNHLLSFNDLSEFHSSLVPEFSKCKNKGSVMDKVIREVINYVRKIPSIDDYTKIGHDVFQSAKDSSDPRFKKLRESVEYYSLGGPSSKRRGKMEPFRQRGKLYSQPKDGIKFSHEIVSTANVQDRSDDKGNHSSDKELANGINGDENPPAIAEADCKVAGSTLASESPSTENEGTDKLAKDNTSTNGVVTSIQILPIPDEVRRTAADRHRHGAMSPYVHQVISYGELKFPVILENMKPNNLELPRIHEFYQPLRQSIYAILFNLHHHRFAQRQQEDAKRILESDISNLVSKSKDSKLSEDETPEIIEQLKNLKKELSEMDDPEVVSEVRIREWLPYNSYQKPVIVKGVEVPWGIPTIQRLWFGTSSEDNEKRIRAFMSCMRCDDVKPLLLQTAIIPAHLLFMSCILRYILVSSPYPILKKPELDAFLLTSLNIGNSNISPQNPPPQLDIVTPRGVMLASLFMEGVEMALFANDVCGAPLPLHMTLPWTFFNGVMFHSYLRKSGTVRNLYELCGRNDELVSRVELMKSAIIPELMNRNDGLLGWHPKRGNLENGHASSSMVHPRGSWQLHPAPFSNGRVLARKKGIKGGKSVSVVKTKKSEAKKIKSPLKTKEMNGTPSLAH